MTEDRIIIHQSPFQAWFATQDGTRGVWFCDKASEQKVNVEPPTEWGLHWAWNVTEDGLGIYFRHTGQFFAAHVNCPASAQVKCPLLGRKKRAFFFPSSVFRI